MRPNSLRRGGLLFALLILILALLPALNILHLIASTGANNPSNDYLRTINLIDQMLSGDYPWGHYFRDTLENRFHSFAFLVFIRLILIKLTHGNIYAELYTGYFLAVIKVLLLYFLLAPRLQARLRSWLWPILSALVFSTCQISALTYGITALQLGLIQVGVFGGILALSRSRKSWAGALGMIAGGLVASWSGGPGLLSWPIFLLGLLLLRSRKVFLYASWAVGMMLGLWPYVAFGILGNPGSLMKFSLERVRFVITAIGYPFLNQIGSGGLAESMPGFLIGVLGLGLGISGLAIAWMQRKPNLEGLFAALILMAFGGLNAIQTGTSRVLLAPWYTTSFMPFWIGLVGLALTILPHNNPLQANLAAGQNPLGKLGMLWAGSVLISTSFLYATTNLTYRDKSFYLAARSPASAACLRNYRTAPTYCEGLVFQWGIGNPDYLAQLAWPMEKHQLSVFAPRQQWSLQGDFVLGRVAFHQAPGSAITWLDPGTGKPASWSDYHRLDLLIPAHDSVSWMVPIPASANQASLRSAIKAHSSSDGESSGEATFAVYLVVDGAAPQLLYSQALRPNQTGWQKLSTPLAEFAGQTIELIFALESAGAGPEFSAVLRYPVIDLELDAAATPLPEPRVAPANTDLSLEFPAPTQQDNLLDINTAESWAVQGAVAAPGSEGTWTVAADPYFTYKPPLGICIQDYPKFYMRLGVSDDITPRAAQVMYRHDLQADSEPWQSFWIPLLADGSVHAYTYDLRLLSLPAPARLTALRFDPVVNGAPNGASRVAIEQIGFLYEPGSQSDGCGS